MGHPKPTRSTKIRNVVGSALRAAREARGLSQADLAAKLQRMGWDVGRTTWTKIELGERTLTDCELITVADALELSLDTLVASADRVKVKEILGTLER